MKSTGGTWFGRDADPTSVEISSFIGDVFLENTQGSYGRFYFLADEVHPVTEWVFYEITVNPADERVTGRWDFGGGANDMDQLLNYPISNMKIRMEYGEGADLTTQIGHVAILGVMPDKVASSIQYAVIASSGILLLFFCIGVSVFARSERKQGRKPYERIRNKVFGKPLSENQKLAAQMHNDPLAAGLGAKFDH